MRYPMHALLLATALLLSACAGRPLPQWEPPLARTEFQTVRTTAYFDGEADHLRYTNHNALGTTLLTGPVNSAAADWGRWPAGTMFRILQNNRTYVVDDYGWDLAGTNTIDIYQPTRGQMDEWGVRRVDIQILQWGDPSLSYHVLQPRAGYRHVQRMLAELRPELNRSPVKTYTMPPLVQPASAYEEQPVAAEFTRPGASRSNPGSNPASSSNGVPLTPFY